MKTIATRERNFGLDVLRSLAIIGVLAVHLLKFQGVPSGLARFLSRGWIGVDLFFVLSGFLITDQILNLESVGTKFNSVKAFWFRRITRTFPLYFTVLAVYLIRDSRFFNWKYLCFLQNTQNLKGFIQSWSLCIEEQFYFVFPILFYFWMRSKNKIFWLAPLLVSVLLRAYFFLKHGAPWIANQKIWEFDTEIRYRTLTHLDSISMGIILAITKDSWQNFNNLSKNLMGLVGTLLVAMTCFTTTYSPTGLGTIYLFSILALGFSGILIALYEFDMGHLWIKYCFERLAIFSYGIYLWNSLVLDYTVKNLSQSNWAFNSVVFVLSSIALAGLTYRLIEKPGLKLRSNYKEPAATNRYFTSKPF